MKSRNTTPIMSQDDNSCEFSPQIRSFEGELEIGFIIVFISLIVDSVTLLISIVDVDVDDDSL